MLLFCCFTWTTNVLVCMWGNYLLCKKQQKATNAKIRKQKRTCPFTRSLPVYLSVYERSMSGVKLILFAISTIISVSRLELTMTRGRQSAYVYCQSYILLKKLANAE